MTIQNTFAKNHLFRYVHIEHARTSQDIDILHHVAYPYPERDIPILGMDVLMHHGEPTMLIVDMSLDRQLPMWKHLVDRCISVQGTEREMPAWGRPIFSDGCVFVSKPGGCNLEEQLCRLQMAYAQLAMTAGVRPGVDHTAFHKLYCMQQRKNEKTRNMLRMAFGESMADHYMDKVMFPF